MPSHNYSTGEMEKRSGVPRMTFHRWAKKGLLGPVKTMALPGNGTLYLWEEKHVKAAVKLKGTLKPGPKAKAKAKSSPGR